MTTFWSRLFLFLFGKDGKRGILIPLILMIVISIASEGIFGWGSVNAFIVEVILLGLFPVYLWYGFRTVSADPVTAAVMQLFGNYSGGLKGPGLRFYPPGYSSVDINVTLTNRDIMVETRVTDRSLIRVEIGITFKPNTKDGDETVNFIKAGKEAGAFNILNDVVSTAIRQWATSPEEGPATWVDAVASREEALVVLLQAVNGNAILGNSDEEIEKTRIILQRIGIPLVILYKRKTFPRKKPNEIEAAQWGGMWNGKNHKDGKDRDWEIYEDRIAGLSTGEIVTLETSLKCVREHLRTARQGNADIAIRDLGVILTRLNIKETQPLGEVAKAAEKQAKEEQERLGEITELNHVADRIRELVSKAGIPPALAAEMVQTERGKVIKNIQENKYNLAPDIIAALPAILSAVLGNRGGSNP
jgi:regulator of protease activity HflC (stomatin/prohibitin superfamily)